MEHNLDALAKYQQDAVATVTAAIEAANAATRERLVAEARHLLPEGARSLALELEVDDNMTWFYTYMFVDADGREVDLLDGSFDEVNDKLGGIAGDLWFEGSEYGMNGTTRILLDLAPRGDA